MNPGACRQSSTVLFGSVETFLLLFRQPQIFGNFECFPHLN